MVHSQRLYTQRYKVANIQDTYEIKNGPQRFVSIVVHILIGILVAATVALVLGFAVKALWNWLMPGLFGLSVITFWQAWGLVVLSHILFKSFPHHNQHHDKHSKIWRKKFHRQIQDPPEIEQE